MNVFQDTKARKPAEIIIKALHLHPPPHEKKKKKEDGRNIRRITEKGNRNDQNYHVSPTQGIPEEDWLPVTHDYDYITGHVQCNVHLSDIIFASAHIVTTL